jgi:hypothetical protein
LAVVALPAVAGAIAAGDTSAAPVRVPSVNAAAAETLTFEATLSIRYPPTTCPAGTGASVECSARTGSGIVRGLGNVDESYAYLLEDSPEGCSSGLIRLPPTTARLSVAGKGAIDVQVEGSGCLNRENNTLQTREIFVITGGSGRYMGASGGGTIDEVSFGPPNFAGRDTWKGTLTVPGVDFDVTPPTFKGARSRTIRIPRRLKRIRVAYTVTARDDVDGTRPVTCRPRSGSWFTVGRTTRVRCSATDTSGNGSTATFAVTAKRTR